jgi:predicted O-methyltransferase YrrM
MQLQWRDLAPGPGPAINTSLTARETAELQLLAKDGDVLEVGSAYGYSTVALALVAKHVTAVDPHTGHDSYLQLMANLGAYGVAERVTVMQARSQEVLYQLYVASDARYDLVWIDGDHTADVVEHDVSWAQKMLKPGGVIACHDYNEDSCPGVKVALDKLFGGPGRLVDTLAIYEGLA